MGRYRISKTFTFEAAHHLPNLPEGHRCRRPHGHSYVVTLEVACETLAPAGWIFDYGDLAPFATYLARRFDHQDLNAQVSFVPTAENLARHFYDWCKDQWPLVVRCTVAETAKTTASYGDD